MVNLIKILEINKKNTRLMHYKTTGQIQNWYENQHTAFLL